VVEEELTAALAEFAANYEVPDCGCWTPVENTDLMYPIIVTQTTDRSNMPAMESVHDVVEDWRPEYVVLVGIAGGIVRAKGAQTKLKGPHVGDVVCAEYVHYGDYTKRVDGLRLIRYFPLAHPDTHTIQHFVKPEMRTRWFDQLPPRPEEPGTNPRVHLGEIVAVEFLAGDASYVEQREIFAQYDHALAVDMESGGVARALHTGSTTVHYRPIWLCIRGISDRTADTEHAQELLGEGDNDAERELWRDYAAAAAARFARRCVERLLKHARLPGDSDPGAPGWEGVGD
jgi:nucleoside phosphorylase